MNKKLQNKALEELFERWQIPIQKNDRFYHLKEDFKKYIDLAYKEGVSDVKLEKEEIPSVYKKEPCDSGYACWNDKAGYNQAIEDIENLKKNLIK